MGLHGDGEQATSLRCWCWARRREGGLSLSGEPGRVWIWWCGSGVSLLEEEKERREGGRRRDGEKTGEPGLGLVTANAENGMFAGRIGLLVALLATVV